MLVLTPVSAIHSTWPTYPPVATRHTPVFSQAVDVELLVQQIAQQYAIAQAQEEAARRQQELQRKQEELKRRQLQERLRRQATFEAFYGEYIASLTGRPVENVPKQTATRERAFFGLEEESYARALAVAEREAAQRLLAAQNELKRIEQERLSLLSAGHNRSSGQVKRAFKHVQPCYCYAECVCTPTTPAKRPCLRPVVAQANRSDQESPITASNAPTTPHNLQHAPATEPSRVPTLKDLLQHRLQTEQDPEVLESASHLLQHLFDDASSDRKDVKGKGKERAVDNAPFPSETQTTAGATAPSSDERVHDQSSSKENADRSGAISPELAQRILKVFRSRRARRASLGQIQEIEDTLRALEASFTFPEQLDFSPPSSPGVSATDLPLAYTANNTPVHTYEHALNGLLTRLDAVESGGDLAIRGRRKEVVNEVERALREVERRVEESRERESNASPTSDSVDASVQDEAHNPPDGQQQSLTNGEEQVQASTEEETVSHVAVDDTVVGASQPDGDFSADSSVESAVPQAPTEPIVVSISQEPIVVSISQPQPDDQLDESAVSPSEIDATVAPPSSSSVDVLESPLAPADSQSGNAASSSAADENGSHAAPDATTPSSEASSNSESPAAEEQSLIPPSSTQDDPTREEGSIDSDQAPPAYAEDPSEPVLDSPVPASDDPSSDTVSPDASSTSRVSDTADKACASPASQDGFLLSSSPFAEKSPKLGSASDEDIEIVEHNEGTRGQSDADEWSEVEA